MRLGQRYKQNRQQAFVPQEILVEILKRLPTKSLLRFKTVSKSWYGLITSPSFLSIHSYFINHPDRRQLLVTCCNDNGKFIGALISDDGDVTKPKWPTSCITNILDDPHQYYSPRTTMISMPVNGIYTLRMVLNESPFNTLALALWNMSTRDVHILPPISYPDHYIEYGTKSLSRGHVSYGFGFNSSVNDYNVVAITNYSSDLDDCLVSCFQIYSLSTNTWKHFPNPSAISLPIPSSADVQGFYNNLPYGGGGLDSCGYYLKDACHWEYSYFSSQRKCRCIVCFDFKDQVFRLFTLPQALLIKKGYYMFTSVDGSLALVCSVQTTSRGQNCLLSEFKKFEVWWMREYGVDSSWSKLYNITLPGRNAIFLSIIDKKIYVQQRNTKHIWCYGVEDDDRCRVYDCSLPKKHYIGILPYSESLVPIKSTSTTLQFK